MKRENLDPMDEIIAGRLKEHISEMDVDLSWDSLVKEQKKRERKPWFVYIISILSLFLVAIVGYTFLNTQVNQDIEQVSKPVVNLGESLMDQAEDKRKEQNVKFQEEQKSSLNTDPVVKVYSMAVDKNGQSASSNRIITPTTKGMGAPKERNADVLSTPMIKDFATENDKGPLNSINKNQKVELFSAHETTKQAAVPGQKESNKVEKKIGRLKTISTLEKDINHIVHYKDNWTLTPLEISVNSVSQNESKNIKLNSSSNLITVSLRSGLYRTTQSFTARNTAHLSLSNIRSELESPAESYRTDLLLHWHLTDKLTAVTGVNYGIAFSKSEWTSTREQSYFLENIVLTEQVLKPSGELVQTFGDTTVTGTQTTTGTIYNRYSSLDLQLGLGYKVGSFNKLSVTLNGSVMYSLASRNSGRVLSEDLSPVNNTFYSRSGHMMYGLSMDLNYALTSDISVVLSPSWRQSLNSATLTEYGLSSKYAQAGVALGASWSF